MPFSKPTLQDIVDRIEADIEARVTDVNTPLLRRSVLRVLARVVAGAVYLLYGFLSWIKDQMFVSTADTDNLEIAGNEYGVSRKAPTYSKGSVDFVGCTPAGVITIGSELEAPDGQVYTVDDSVIVDGAGEATVDITAKIAGSDGDQAAGTVMTFVTPIAGISSSGTVDADLITDGLDEESDDDYRDRVLERKRQPPHGGAEFDYEVWAKEISGVTRAWTIPQYNGLGTLGLAFVRDNDLSSIIPDSVQIAEVLAYILYHIDTITGEEIGTPVTAEEGIFMIALTEEAINFDIDIYPNTPTIQAAILSQLDDLIVQEGGPGETIYENEQVAAINAAAGIIAFRINTPGGDIASATNKVPVLRTVTFGDY
jgi:uncharacterized phage protein gp47/JayE